MLKFSQTEKLTCQYHPVGFRGAQSFNRYAYANNNPYKFVDPDGKDAMITYLRDGSINIAIPTTFTGSAATGPNIESLKRQVSNRWSGEYRIDGKLTKVKVEVTDTTPGSVGPTNKIKLTDGPTSNMDPGHEGGSFVQKMGDGRQDNGEWRGDSPDNSDGTYPHEAGHLMGADDAQWTPNVDIMGDVSKSPSDATMQEVLNFEHNWVDDRRE